MNSNIESPKQSLKPSISNNQEIYMLRKLLPWKDLETKTFIDNFDHNLFTTLLFHKIEKYQKEELFLLGKDEIKDQRLPDENLVAAYIPMEELILMDVEKIKQIFPLALREIGFLNCLIHELVHSASYHSLQESNQKDYYKRVLQVGFDTSMLQIDSKERISRERKWEFWNEGVTELFTRELLGEYIKYKGLEKEYMKYIQESEDNKDILIRSHNVNEVNSIIETLSKKLNQEKPFIKEAIFRGMFEGEDYLEEDIKKELDALFYKGFTGILSRK